MIEDGSIHRPDGSVVMTVTECLIPISVLASLTFVRVSIFVPHLLILDSALQSLKFIWIILLCLVYFCTSHDLAH